MRFCYGATRWVIVTQHHAIKIPRIRPFRAILQLVKHTRNREVGIRLRQFGNTPARAIGRYILSGFVANLEEARVSACFNDSLIAPTRYSFPLGLFNIQVRGEPASEEQARCHPLFTLPEHMLDAADLSHHIQYGMLGGKPVLLDYGHDRACELLKLLV